MLGARLFVMILIAVGSAAAQNPAPSPTPAAFHSSLLLLQKQLPEWEKVVQAVEVEQLPVSYAHGALIEKSKQQSLQWTRIAQLATNKVLATDSLADEINLASVLSELSHSLSDLAMSIDEVDIPKGPVYETRNGWASRLQDLSGGPVNTISQESLSFVMARADDFQKRLYR